MRVAVITDIHGNLAALDAVLASVGEIGVDELYCGGDLVGCGAHPNEVCALIEHTDEASKAFMRDLPFDLRSTMGASRVRLVHGSPRTVNEYLFEDEPASLYERLAAQADADVLVFGRTHTPWVREYGGVLFVNCGSAGKTKDGDPRAAFAVLETTAEGVAREVAAAGLPPEFAEKLVLAA